LVALLLLALPAAAQTAEDAPDEPVATFRATTLVRERPLASATASVTVLDREAIESSGSRTVADVLRFVPGVDVTSGGARGGLTTAQIRGGDPNFTLVLLDGVPLNDSTYQVGDVFDLQGLPASAVERIEIVRGPLSSFYGSTGLAGALNIVTRSGQAGPATAEVEAMAGDASLRQGSGAFSGSLAGRGTWFLGASWEEEAERIAAESFEHLGVVGNVTLPVGSRGRLHLRTRGASWAADDYPDASGGPVYGSGELRTSEHDEASFGAELLLDGQRPQRWTAAIYRHTMDRETPAVPFVLPPITEETFFTRLRASWGMTLLTAESLQWTAGVDVQREEGENESALLLPPEFGGAVPGDYAITRTLPGATTELTWSRGPLAVEVGSRFDLPEDHAAQWSPRLGLSWQLGDGGRRVHASAGRAFKMPSFFALASPSQLGGNPALRPETVLGGDIGVEGPLFSSRLAGLDGGFTVFYNRYEDLIDFDFESFTHLNRSEVEARGVEARLDWRPTARLALHANGTWQEVEDLATQARLRHRPKRTGGARLVWTPRAEIDLQLDLQAVSKSFDEQIPVPDRDTVPGRELLGLSASWQVAESWRLRARIDNLADETYEELIGFPGAGRSFRLGLRYSTRLTAARTGG
jgi:iron complex outermembrane receptor protein/vitamin B12 transporter